MLQLDALQRQGDALPPVGGALLRAGLDDGNVQPPCQRGEVGVHGDDHGVALRPDGGHLRQTGGVALGLPRPLQRGHHIPGGEGRAVGERDAGLQRQGVGAFRRVVGAAPGQYRPEGEVLVQLKQLFVQQRAHRCLHRLRGGDGVKALAGEIGQGEGGQRLRLRRLVFLAVKL